MTQTSLTERSPDGSPLDTNSRFFSELQQTIARTVKEQMCALQDRKSFATASPWLSQVEACEYLKMSRTTLYDRRRLRKLAKTTEAKEQAFAPEYGEGANLRFRRDELDAWMVRQRA